MQNIKPKIYEYLSIQDLCKIDQRDLQVLQAIVKKQEENKITVKYFLTVDSDVNPLAEDVCSEVEYYFENIDAALNYDFGKYYEEKFTEEEIEKLQDYFQTVSSTIINCDYSTYRGSSFTYLYNRRLAGTEHKIYQIQRKDLFNNKYYFTGIERIKKNYYQSKLEDYWT